MSSDALKEYLAENPRMLGLLFMVTTLLAQAGTAAAECNCTYSGP